MLIETNTSSAAASNTDTGNALVTQAKSQSNKNQKTQKKGTCFHCKKTGHFGLDNEIVGNGRLSNLKNKENQRHRFRSNICKRTNSKYGSTEQMACRATHHMTRCEWMYGFEPIEKGQFEVTIGNEQIIYALGRGNIIVIATVDG